MLLILFADGDSLNVKSRFLAVFLFLSICPTFTCEGCVSEFFFGKGEGEGEGEGRGYYSEHSHTSFQTIKRTSDIHPCPISVSCP